MESTSNDFVLSYSDGTINELIRSQSRDVSRFSKHYNQVEEFFLNLEHEFEVPHFPIHHDVREPRPSDDYLQKLRSLLGNLIELAPSVFQELSYFFNPREILKPCFFRLYKIDNSQYLYLLKIDIMYRSQDDTIIEKGSNDIMPRYSTRHLFLEPILIPLDGTDIVQNKIKSMRVKQTISQTWIGERGRGYFVQGIWMDQDLTKFFSKLFLPQGRRTYPFYPFACKYKTICQTVLDFDAEARRKRLPYLHGVLRFLEPDMRKIEASVKNSKFSEDLDLFVSLKNRIPETLSHIYDDINVRVYLNELDMKEFQITDEPR